MKPPKTALLLALSSLAGLSAFAAEPDIRAGETVRIFINQIGLSERFEKSAEKISATGMKPQWPAAIAGVGKTAGEAGEIHQLKIFSVPFADSSSGHRGVIIGGILISAAASEEFITADSDIIVKYPPAATANRAGARKAQCPAGVKALSRLIESANPSDIWAYILGGITIPDNSIRAAYVISSYSCSAPPFGFPEKNIWYPATCIRSIH